MGTVLPVGVVKALQNRCAQLLEGLTTRIPGGYLSRCRSERGVSPLICERDGEQGAGVLVIVGHRLQPGRCSGACCSGVGSGSISIKQYYLFSATRGGMLRSLGVSFVGSRLCPGGTFL